MEQKRKIVFVGSVPGAKRITVKEQWQQALRIRNYPTTKIRIRTNSFLGQNWNRN